MGNTKLRLQLILVIFLALLQSCESPKSGADNTPVAEIETPTNPTDPDDTPIKTPEQIAAIELRNSSPFILNKVQVGNSDDITSDQELIVIVDDRCRLEQIANDGLTPIDYFTLPVPNENAMDLLIPVQAYSIQLNSDVRIENLSDNISNNPCIVGISHESYLETTAFDDTIFSKQDYLKQINFAKNIDFFQKNTTEKIVKIAILDTGIDLEHEEFSPKSFSTQLVGTNFIDPNSPDFPEEGASYHGTSLTGMLVADSNNMQGIASMNPGNFLILPIKVANDQAITLCSSLINGVFRAVNAGADIINISLGKKFSEDVFHCGSALADATNRAIRRGVFVTIAAGNAEYNEFGEMIPPVKIESPLELKIGSKCLYFPSCLARKFRGMVTVASLDETYKDLADFSNYGDVEIAAPGVGMTTLKKANAYGTVAGTSYSAALVTGAAAYIIGFAKQNGYTYSPWLVEDILLNSAAKADSLTDKVIAGRYLDLSSLKKYLLSYAKKSEQERRAEPIADPEFEHSFLAGDDKGELLSIHILANELQVHIDSRVELHVLAKYENGIDVVTKQSTWSSDKPELFSITEDGVGIPTTAGNFVVEAKFKNLTVNKLIHVTTVSSITGVSSELVDIEIDVADNVPYAQSFYLNAIAHYADGKTRKVTNYTSFSSNNQKELPISSYSSWNNTEGTYAGKTYKVTALYEGISNFKNITIDPVDIASYKVQFYNVASGLYHSENQKDFYLYKKENNRYNPRIILKLATGKQLYVGATLFDFDTKLTEDLGDSSAFKVDDTSGNHYYDFLKFGDFTLNLSYNYQGHGSAEPISLERNIHFLDDKIKSILIQPLYKKGTDIRDMLAMNIPISQTQQKPLGFSYIGAFAVYESGDVELINRDLLDWSISETNNPHTFLANYTTGHLKDKGKVIGIYNSEIGHVVTVSASLKADNNIATSFKTTINRELVTEPPAIAENLPAEPAMTSTPEESFIAKTASGFCSLQTNGVVNTNLDPYAAGDGSVNNPYILCSKEQVNNIAANNCADCSKNFKLMQNIDFTGWEGIAFNRPERFKGVLDGNGFEIQNFNYFDEENNASFIQVNDGVIKNLNFRTPYVKGLAAGVVAISNGRDGQIKNIGIIGGSVEAHKRAGGLVQGNRGIIEQSFAYHTSFRSLGFSDYFGGIAASNDGMLLNTYSHVYLNGQGISGGMVGLLKGKGIVQNCYAKGEVKGRQSVGGLVGAAQAESQIVNSQSSASVLATSSYAGGLVGVFNNYDYGTMGIFRSYSTGSVIASKGVGGLVGYIQGGTIQNSYATGSVQGEDYVGSLVGISSMASRIHNSYSSSKIITSTITDKMGKIIGCEQRGIPSSDASIPGIYQASFYTEDDASLQEMGCLGSTLGNSPELNLIPATTSGQTFTDKGWDLTKIWQEPVSSTTYPLLR